MTALHHDPHLHVMMQAARHAGAQLLQRFRNRDQLLVEYKNPGDLVSIADRESEETITRILDNAFPDYGVLGEEGAAKPANADGYRWVIDPLDATGNFLNGIPFWCVTIALEQHGAVIAGVTYDPVHDEIFSAVRNKGAFLNNQNITTNKKDLLSKAAVGLDVGAPPIAPIYGHAFADSLAQCATASNLRCCALSMAYVAVGRLDIFTHMSKTKPWDMATGSLLVTEAGGVVTNVNRDTFQLDITSVLCAANQTLYDQFVPLLKVT